MRKHYSSLQRVFSVFVTLVALFAGIQSHAQVTTSAISGSVTDQNGEGLPGATVIAIHEPSGSRYGTTTNASGRYNLPAVRVGGPYRITATFVGYREQVVNGITANLGTTVNADFKLTDESAQLQEVVVTTNRSDIFSSDRTGAATTIGREAIQALPTVGRTLSDFTRLTPQGNGSSFGGQDARLNNITIDGAVFNNGFGLGSQPGQRAGVAAISLDALEEVQVNVAPFDVRQSGFTGAGLNAVTRSGTNEISGSAFYLWRNEGELYLGRTARGEKIPVNKFNKSTLGFRLGGPLIKNKLFLFVNGEFEKRVDPGTSWVANRGQTGSNVARTTAADLDEVANLMRTKFGFDPGPYENYNLETRGDKLLARLDWNINDRHKFNFRVAYLDSGSEQNISNSNSIGAGNRRTQQTSMSYKNAGYLINEDYISFIGELNSTFLGGKASNSLIIGNTSNNEDRGYLTPLFPNIDILSGTTNYISVGMDPFTPYNLLRYNTFQLIDNFTYYAGKHTLTAGISVERFQSDNSFYSASVGSYIFNSLADFRTAMNAYNPDVPIVPGTTQSPVSINRFQYRYSLQGDNLPLQQTKVFYPGVYIQDEYQVAPSFKVTAGFRVDVPFFGNTGFENPVIAALTFRDEFGVAQRYSTSKLPDPKPLFSPRLGFNWDVANNKRTQLRGGTGIFTGRPPFVWISNQIGQNGVLSGLIDVQNTRAYPFTLDPSVYRPANGPTGTITYDINVTDPEYKFPQVWKSNFAIDQRLPLGTIFTLEGIYNKNVNATYYIDANKEAPTGNFTGADKRPRYPASGLTGSAATNAIRINDNVVQNLVLKRTNAGYGYSLTAKLEKPFTRGFYAMAAYTFAENKDFGSPGSTAVTSYTNLVSARGSNYVDLTFSDQDQRHRFIGSLSYKLTYGGRLGGSSQISMFYEARNQGRYSYIVGGDLNGDGIAVNDILYVPRNTSDANEILFTNLTVGTGANARIYTPAEQAAAFEAYIQQDELLRNNRGRYIERNAGLRPWVKSLDLSFIQEFYVKVGNKPHAIQLRADVLNFGNLLNDKWGVGYTQVNNRPLSFASVNAAGQPVYRIATQNKGGQTVLLQDTFVTSLTTSDVWNAQFGIRYSF